jgi:hypothetical protein
MDPFLGSYGIAVEKVADEEIKGKTGPLTHSFDCKTGIAQRTRVATRTGSDKEHGATQ